MLSLHQLHIYFDTPLSNKSKVTCKKKGHVANKDLYCHGLVNIAMEISFFTLACRMTDDTSNKTKATCL
jgi:hypothetical protein